MYQVDNWFGDTGTSTEQAYVNTGQWAGTLCSTTASQPDYSKERLGCIAELHKEEILGAKFEADGEWLQALRLLLQGGIDGPSESCACGRLFLSFFQLLDTIYTHANQKLHTCRCRFFTPSESDGKGRDACKTVQGPYTATFSTQYGPREYVAAPSGPTVYYERVLVIIFDGFGSVLADVDEFHLSHACARGWLKIDGNVHVSHISMGSSIAFR